MDDDAVPAEGEQLALLRTAARPRRPKPPEGRAEVDPIAEVVLDVPLAHLDRRFEYAVPASRADVAVPGVRVRVRFAGQDADGFVVARKAEADHQGRLAPLSRVVSDEPVLSPDLLTLCRAVADRYGGTLADVLRLAIPPRHAKAEAAAPGTTASGATAPDEPVAAPAVTVDRSPWSPYPAGPALLDRLAAGDSPRAVWTAVPGTGPDGSAWPDAVAAAVAATLGSGRGALVVVPDHRDVERVGAALDTALGSGQHVRLTADDGAAARYTAWLAALRGTTRCVVGTRAAMFAPVRDLGLVVCWDDGDDLHAEPHAPYPHVRDVLTLRADLAGAAALVGGHVRTAEGELLCDSGWARPVVADRSVVRRLVAPVRLTGEGVELERDAGAQAARLPSLAWRTAREGLEQGPVLVQVPRGGYLPALSCQRCRTPARCSTCHGPLALTSGHAVPHCRWCGRPDGSWACAECGDRRLRSVVVGQGRTAEELGRAFPGTTVRSSAAGAVLARVPSAPALVVATPGAEPVADGGYAAVLLLDGRVPLERADLRASEEALRRWAAAAALARSAAAGGRVVLVAPAGLPPVEALLRWDPGWHAGLELAARRELGFPPAVRVATLTGPRAAVDSLVRHADLPSSAQVLGPVQLATAPRRSGAPAPEEPPYRALVRAPLPDGPRLVAALHAAAAVRSARKEPGAVRLQVDPLELV